MVETLPPLVGSGARFLLAGLVFAAVMLAREGLAGLRLSRQEWAASAVVGIALLFGGNGLVTVAENMGLALRARRARHRLGPAVGRRLPPGERRGRRRRH